MRKRLIVLVLIIGLVLLLTSCSFRITFTTPPIPSPTTPLECSVTVISRNDCVLGYVCVNGENTWKWLSKWGHVVINDVPCCQSVSVRLYIPPYHFSHVVYTYPMPEAENFVYFYHY